MAKIRDANTLMSLLAVTNRVREDLANVAEKTQLPTFEATPEIGA